MSVNPPAPPALCILSVETTVNFTNNVDKPLDFCPPPWIWAGDKSENGIPKQITHSAQFKHDGDNTGSVAGLAYHLEGSALWVVAWCNLVASPVNLAYTKIIPCYGADVKIDWDEIYKDLQKGSNTSDDTAAGLNAHIEITDGSKATVTAILGKI